MGTWASTINSQDYQPSCRERLVDEASVEILLRPWCAFPRIHVAIWYLDREVCKIMALMAVTIDLEQLFYILLGFRYTFRAQSGSHIIALGPEYIAYSYMEPLGFTFRLYAGHMVTVINTGTPM